MRERTLFVGLALAAAIWFAPLEARAVWETECGVAYRRADFSWSRVYDQVCTFATGQELAAATGDYGYQIGAVYAAFWWGRGQVTVVRVTTFMLDVGFDGVFSLDDARQLFMLQGAVTGRQANDSRRRNWRVSVKRSLGTWSAY